MRTLVVAVLALSSLAAMAGEAKLRYRWKAGAEYHYQLVENSEARIENHLSKEKNADKNEHRIGRRWRILKVAPDGTAEIEVTCEYSAMRVWQGDGVVTSDSRDTAHDDLGAKLLRVVVGTTYRVQVSDRGEVLKVLGLEEALDQARERLDAMKVPDDAKRLVDAQMQALLGEDGARETVSEFLAPLPEAPVHEGSTWEKKLDSRSEIGSQTGKLTYRLQSDPSSPTPQRILAEGNIKLVPKLETVDVETERGDLLMEWTLEPGTGFPVEIKLMSLTIAHTFAKAPGQRVLAFDMKSKRTLHQTVGSKPPESIDPSASQPPPPVSSTPARPAGGHTGPILAIAFNADTSRFVSGGTDRTVKVWHLPEHGLPLTLSGHAGSVIAVGFASDGQRVVSASEDGVVKVWEVASGRELRSVATGPGLRRIAFSASGGRAVIARGAGPGSEIELWDLDAGRKLRTLARPAAATEFLSLSADGRRMVATARGALDAFDADSGARLIPSFTGSLTASAVRADGGAALLEVQRPVEHGRGFELVDLTTGAILHKVYGLPDGDMVTAIALSRDAGRAIVAIGPGIAMFDFRAAASGFKEVPGVRCVALTSDGDVMSWTVGNDVSFTDLSTTK